jgi:hypothetical protein
VVLRRDHIEQRFAVGLDVFGGLYPSRGETIPIEDVAALAARAGA